MLEIDTKDVLANPEPPVLSESDKKNKGKARTGEALQRRLLVQPAPRRTRAITVQIFQAKSRNKNARWREKNENVDTVQHSRVELKLSGCKI